MSKATYYQTDFKPDYELFQQKISELSRQKGKITKTDINLQKLKTQLELINEQIDDQGLSFDNSSIFLRYASIQQLAQKKKTASDCCLHCGQEMKKSIQCQFCAELYCKNCCWRKRVIPFQQHSDFRLCCEQCHQKYIKHFNNQQFYKEKAIYQAAIDELQRKYQKTKTKYQKKENEVKEYKEQKRSLKVRQSNLKKALLQEEKAIKFFSQEYQKAVQNKALQLKSEQDRQKNQNKQLQQERQRFQQQKQAQQQRRIRQLEEQQYKMLQQSRRKQEELAKRQAEVQRQKQQLQRQKRELTESRLKKVQQQQKQKQKEFINKLSSQSIEITPQKYPLAKYQTASEKEDIRPQQQQTKNKMNSYQPSIDGETPRKVVFTEDIDFDSILKDVQKPKQEQEVIEQKKETQNNQQKHQVTLKQFLKEMKENKKIQKQQSSTKIQQTKGETIKKTQKQSETEKQNKSEKSKQSGVSESPKLTMKQIKTMSINDLLSMKIPMNPGVSSQQKRPRKSSHPDVKVDAEENSTTTQNEKMYQSLLQPYMPQSSLCGLALPAAAEDYQESIQKQQILRQSIKSVHEQEQQQDAEKETNKRALLRQSLISSSNKVSLVGQKPPAQNDQQTPIGEPQKCTCQIM